MDLSESDIQQFDKLCLQNGDAVTAAIGSATILSWEIIPPDVRDAIVKTADLLEPIRKDPEVPAERLRFKGRQMIEHAIGYWRKWLQDLAEKTKQRDALAQSISIVSQRDIRAVDDEIILAAIGHI